MSTTHSLKITVGEDEHPVFDSQDFIFEPTWVLAFADDGQVASMMTIGWSYDRALAALTSLQELLMRRAGFFDRDFPGFAHEEDDD